MTGVKWGLVVALALVSSPVLAYEGVVAPPAPAWSPFEMKILPAVLHLPAPGDEPLSSIRFAAAPPLLPGNRCEAQCLADFRRCEAECRDVICLIPCDFLLDLCAAGCTDGA